MNRGNLIQYSRTRGISLTALIDVVFILLMFFMLTSTFIDQHIVEVNIPDIAQGSSDSKTQLLVIGEDDNYTFYDETSHPIASHPAAQWLEITTLLRPNKPLIVLPEKRVSLEKILHTMERLKQSGVNTLTLGQSVKSSRTATPAGTR